MPRLGVIGVGSTEAAREQQTGRYPEDQPFPLLQWAFQLSQDPQTLEQALAAAQRGTALNDASPLGHGTLSFVYLWQKQYDQAVAEMERVIALAPIAAGGYAGLAEIMGRMGRSEEALGMVEQALRRNPIGVT